MIDLDAYRTKGKRPVLSYDLFFDQYKKYTKKAEAEAFRFAFGAMVLIHDINANDKLFLTRIGFLKLPEGTTIRHGNINGWLFFPFWRPTTLKTLPNSKGKLAFQKLEQYEALYFEETDGISYLFDVLFKTNDFTIPNKLCFKNKEAENAFLNDFKEVLFKIGHLTHAQAARRIHAYTNTKLSVSTIKQYLKTGVI